MTFKSTLIAAGLLLGSVFSANASSIADIGSATFKLYDGDGRGYCSAEVVGDNLLLTANHCAGEAGMNIRFPVYDKDKNIVSYTVYYVKAVRTLKGQDVALLEVVDSSFNFKDKGVVPVDIASEEEAKLVTFGDDVWAVGYPAALELTITEGLFGEIIKSPSDLWEGLVYRFTAPIIGGNSGGGLYVFIDGEYKLIGVTVGGYNSNGAFMNIATPVESIYDVTKGFVEAKTKEIIEEAPVTQDGRTDSK